MRKLLRQPWVWVEAVSRGARSRAPRAVRVRVPATSANLGPGFDSLALALGMYDEATVTLRSDDQNIIGIAGLGADSLPRDERHLLLRSFRSAAASFGLVTNAVEISALNAIPQGRGLGSSAATIVAGVAAAWMLAPGHDEMDLLAVLRVAAGIEGHPDNVAACVYGGLTISWHTDDSVEAVALPIHAQIEPVLFLPAGQMSTQLARGLLPATVPHVDAAFNVGRSALLIHALIAAPHLLMNATEDRLHQPYRAPAMPASAELLRGLRQADIPAVISGAGSSVLALCTDAAAALELVPEGWAVHRLSVAAGVEVRRVEDNQE